MLFYEARTLWTAFFVFRAAHCLCTIKKLPFPENESRWWCPANKNIYGVYLTACRDSKCEKPAQFFVPAANSAHEKSVARCGGQSRQQRKLLLFLLSFMFNFTRQNWSHHGKAAGTAEKPASKLIRWFNRGVAFASAFVLIAVNKVLNLNVRIRKKDFWI